MLTLLQIVHILNSDELMNSDEFIFLLVFHKVPKSLF